MLPDRGSSPASSLAHFGQFDKTRILNEITELRAGSSSFEGAGKFVATAHKTKKRAAFAGICRLKSNAVWIRSPVQPVRAATLRAPSQRWVQFVICLKACR